MTTQLPRPIEPGEIKAGMRVRKSWFDGSTGWTVEFDVIGVDADTIRSDRRPYPTVDSAWTLLAEVPTPAPAVGSRWRDPVNNVSYIVADDGSYLPYTYQEQGLSSLRPGNRQDDEEIARLTPIPDHGDGCSEWLWDKVSASAYVLAKDGSYHVVQGDGYPLCAPFARYSCVRDCASVEARLIPWSERGQR